MYFRTMSFQPDAAAGEVSTSSESSSAKMRRSATILPFGVNAAAYCPSPATSDETSLVTMPVSSSAALSTTAAYAVKISHRVARSAAAASQRRFDSPVRAAPASSRWPKLPSRRSRFAWMPSRSAVAAVTAAAACSRVISIVMGQAL